MSLWKSRKNEEQEISAFWQNLEDELGERIIARSIGEYYSGYEGMPGPLWGLFFLTDYSFHFRHFSQQNWFSMLMQASGTDVRNEDRSFSIPREDIDRAETLKAGSLLSRLIAPPQPVLAIEYRDAARIRQELRIRIEQNRELFFSELNAMR